MAPSLAFNMFTEAVAGGCGGFISSFVLFPLDALKVTHAPPRALLLSPVRSPIVGGSLGG